MPKLRFTDRVEIAAVADLPTPLHGEQLQAAGKLYDGEDRSIADRLHEDGPDAEEGSFAGFCDLWKVMDGDQHAYDAWFYMVDSGTIFRANTTEKVAEVVQFGLECEDKALRAQLGPAMVAARLLPQSDGSYAEFKALLDQDP